MNMVKRKFNDIFLYSLTQMTVEKLCENFYGDIIALEIKRKVSWLSFV